jgi:hypothetical protein
MKEIVLRFGSFLVVSYLFFRLGASWLLATNFFDWELTGCLLLIFWFGVFLIVSYSVLSFGNRKGAEYVALESRRYKNKKDADILLFDIFSTGLSNVIVWAPSGLIL